MLRASTPAAPPWRRWVAHAIDLVIVLEVVALFLTPVVTLYSRDGSPSALLRASAWVYVAVFVALGVSIARDRKRRRRYVTIGMSILDLEPARIGSDVRMVSRASLPEDAMRYERHGLAMAAVAAPAMLVGCAFIVFELIAYL